MLTKSPRALSRFICTLEAPYCTLRSKFNREEAMAKSRGRLYLCMCLAAALASFLAGLMVGKCTNPSPWAQGRGSSSEKDRAGLSRPAELSLSADGELPEFQPNWKPNGIWAFLIKCDRNPDLSNAHSVQGTDQGCWKNNSELSLSAGMKMVISVPSIMNELKLVIKEKYLQHCKNCPSLNIY